MKKPFTLVNYNPNWTIMFEQEKAALQNALGNLIHTIHHIGSTAIKTTKSKPEIDIAIVTVDDSIVINAHPKIERLGYQVRNEMTLPNDKQKHFYYSKDSNNVRTHKLHIYGNGHPDILNQLLFVKYLNENPIVGEDYAKLKVDLSKKYNYGNNILKYIDGKTQFIQTILSDAKLKYPNFQF